MSYLKARFSLLLVPVVLLLASVASQAQTPAATPKSPNWKATGTLLEACTCSVPCTCNFGEGPSPQHYCHSIYAYRLTKAEFDGVDLSGLIIAGADAGKGSVGFLDDHATLQQRPALEKMAKALFASGGPSSGPRRFVFVSMGYTVDGNDLKLNIPGYGGFTAKVIIGRDGKSPVVVENNTIWPIPRAIKGKTAKFTFTDKVAGKIDTSDSNANYGEFVLGTNSSTAD